MESEDSKLNYNTSTKLIRFTPDPHHQENSQTTRNNIISISSDTHSYGQRDSRFHSIYDQYLSDPAESSIDHPLQPHPSTAQNTPPSAYSFLSQQTIRKDSLANSDIIEEMTSPTRYNHQIAPSSRPKVGTYNANMRNRESQADGSAWAGMMTGNVDSDDSDSSDDSDDERIRKSVPQAKRAAQPASKIAGTAAAGSSSRNSWTSRAAAVGSRPPDSASQNPPTLKLLGLKSVKEGGNPIGYGGSNPAAPQQETNQQHRNPAFDRFEQEERDRIVSTSDYGDELDRHDSFIEEFDGKRNAPILNTNSSPQKGSAKLQPPSSSISDSRPVSPRTALTRQLGLITPQIPLTSPQEQSHRPGVSDGYFPPMMTPSSSSGDSSSNHSQTRTLLATQPTLQRATPPSGLSIPPPSQAIPLQRNQIQSPLYPPSSPNYGPVPPPMRKASLRGVVPAPMPIPLPSPVYPQAPNIHSGQPRGLPHNPGFSDTPQNRQMRRQPSLLRRSMAFIKGNDPMGMPQSNQYNQQARQGDVGNGQRRSLFRRSMAFLSGKPLPPMQMPPSHDSQLGLHDECDTPQPRVAGFLDEKPKNRRSEYLGGGGIGDEWDYTGTGARFWKRFSMAQRKEQQGANKDSEEFRRKTERRRRWIMYLSLLGGICIIGAVIGIVIWRESVSTSSIPGALDREHNGVNPGPTPLVANTALNSGSVATTSVLSTNTVQDAAATTTSSRLRKHHNNTAKRSLILATTSPLMVEIVRDVIAKAAPFQEAVHPLPRGESLRMSRSRQRRHLQHARNAETRA